MAPNDRPRNRQCPGPYYSHAQCTALARLLPAVTQTCKCLRIVKVAGATAKHCVVLHGKSTFLSGTSSGNDFDHECYTRANVAYSRATDLTISACPVNMQGTTGMAQVLSALLHGACTVYTNDQQTSKTQSTGSGFLNLRLTFTLLRSHSHFGVDCSPSALSSTITDAPGGSGWFSHYSLTHQRGKVLDEQHPVHGKIHCSGLLFWQCSGRVHRTRLVCVA